MLLNELVSWLGTDPTGTQEADVLIMGDLNSYAQRRPNRRHPIRRLHQSAAYSPGRGLILMCSMGSGDTWITSLHPACYSS